MKKIFTGLDSEVKRVPYKNWDPIGVRDLPEADDEYDSYVSNISRMLIDGNTVEDIYDHLRWVESDRIGLDGDELHTRAAANQLIDLAKVYLVTCPCCNKLTLGSQGNYEICDVCG